MGTLDPALSLVVEAHAGMCSHCQAELHAYDAIGGALVDQGDIAGVDADLFSTILKCIEADDRADASTISTSAGIADAGVSEFDRLPPRLRRMAQASMAGRGWNRVAKGLQTLDLAGPSRGDGPSSEIQLLKLEPGAAVPRHTHCGTECTLVLTGAFRDEFERYSVGDFAFGNPDLTHQPIAEDHEICYALSVTTAPVQLTGVLGVLQRIVSP